jgi:excinuclease ABC subunit C
VQSAEYKVLRKKYLGNIRHLKAILDGNIDKVKMALESQMETASKNEYYEKAAIFRNKVRNLIYITRPQMPTDFYLENPNLYEDVRRKEILDLKNILSKFDILPKNLKRIECYDVAHLAGSSPTASMVTFIDGEADKSLYRHFKIRIAKGGDDYGSMKEVIGRRKKHFNDWGKPDLIIVDGGRGQVSIFRQELEGENISVIGLSKRFETLVIPVKMLGTTNLTEYRLQKGAALNLVERLRDEAHRFARVYHHKLVSKELIEGKL